MTQAMQSSQRSAGTQVAIALAATLAVLSLIVIALLLYGAQRRSRAVASQQSSECIEASYRGYGPDVATCIDRYKASAR